MYSFWGPAWWQDSGDWGLPDRLGQRRLELGKKNLRRVLTESWTLQILQTRSFSEHTLSMQVDVTSKQEDLDAMHQHKDLPQPPGFPMLSRTHQDYSKPKQLSCKKRGTKKRLECWYRLHLTVVIAVSSEKVAKALGTNEDKSLVFQNPSLRR